MISVCLCRAGPRRRCPGDSPCPSQCLSSRNGIVNPFLCATRRRYVLAIQHTASCHKFNLQDFTWRLSNPRTVAYVHSKCPLRSQISQGLGPFLQIELLKTERLLRMPTRETASAAELDPRRICSAKEHGPTGNPQSAGTGCTTTSGAAPGDERIIIDNNSHDIVIVIIIVILIIVIIVIIVIILACTFQHRVPSRTSASHARMRDLRARRPAFSRPPEQRPRPSARRIAGSSGKDRASRTCKYVYIYIYIHIERERDRDIDR